MPFFGHLWPSLRKYVRSLPKKDTSIIATSFSHRALLSSIMIDPEASLTTIDKYVEAELYSTKIVFGAGGILIGFCMGFMLGGVLYA